MGKKTDHEKAERNAMIIVDQLFPTMEQRVAYERAYDIAGNSDDLLIGELKLMTYYNRLVRACCGNADEYITRMKTKILAKVGEYKGGSYEMEGGPDFEPEEEEIQEIRQEIEERCAEIILLLQGRRMNNIRSSKAGQKKAA